MQISSSLPTVSGLNPVPDRQHHASEGNAAPAHEPPLSERPVPKAGKSEASDTQTKEDKRTSGGEESQAKSQAREKDPLTDPSSEEYAQIKALQARDSEVRAHEQAHLAVAGQYATSGPTYSYQNGPDGKQYAIGGEVGIDVSAVAGDPAATIAKMQVVQRAAMAPAEPSGQDIRVAAQAGQTASAARAELASQQLQKMLNGGQDADKPALDLRPTATEKEAQQHYLHTQQETKPPLFEANA